MTPIFESGSNNLSMITKEVNIYAMESNTDKKTMFKASLITSQPTGEDIRLSM